jgi:hypothetical protein
MGLGRLSGLCDSYISLLAATLLFTFCNTNLYVSLTHDTNTYPIPCDYLGWWYNDGSAWTPTQNYRVEGGRIAVFLPGIDGALYQSVGNYIYASTHYKYVLGLRYETIWNNNNTQYLITKLGQLLEVEGLSIDFWAFSQGALLARYILETLELALKSQINVAILIFPFNQGLLTSSADFAAGESNGSLAIAASNAVLASVLGDAFLRDTPVNILNNVINYFQGNSEQNSYVPGQGSFISRLNNGRISPAVYEKLKYYTINGLSYDQYTISDLNVFGDNPYINCWTMTYSSPNASVMALLEDWQVRFPSQGQLARYAWRQAENPYYLVFDGLISAQNDILTQKSRFYADNRAVAEFFVPETHSSLAVLDEHWQGLYSSILGSLWSGNGEQAWNSGNRELGGEANRQTNG